MRGKRDGAVREKRERAGFGASFLSYASRKNGFRRETVHASGERLELVWANLQRDCSEKAPRGFKPELQKSLETAANPGDSFTQATTENSCDQVRKVFK
jgi:hypothetical protein